jgi:hypothetical protein
VVSRVLTSAVATIVILPLAGQAALLGTAVADITHPPTGQQHRLVTSCEDQLPV